MFATMLPFNYGTLLLLLVKCGCSVGKVEIEVLFETLCPDSSRFLRQQFYPIWPEIAPFVSVKFVPFGKSQSDDNGARFYCQHGPKECAGNRIVSCGLKFLPSQTLQVEFIKCIMEELDKRNNEIDAFGLLCSSQLGLNWEHVKNCVSTEEGTILQLQAEQETKTYEPSFIPTIIYDGKFDQQAQDISIYNFKAVICAFIRQSEPTVALDC